MNPISTVDASEIPFPTTVWMVQKKPWVPSLPQRVGFRRDVFQRFFPLVGEDPTK